MFRITYILILPVLLALSCATTGTDEAAEQAVKERKIVRMQRSASKVLEGVGWGAFRLGQSRKVMTIALGEPDADSTEKELKWDKHHVSCMITPDQRAYALLFHDGFKHQLSQGVAIGSSELRVLSKYSVPAETLEEGPFKEMRYPEIGLLFRLRGTYVAQIVIFPPGWRDPTAGSSLSATLLPAEP